MFSKFIALCIVFSSTHDTGYVCPTALLVICVFVSSVSSCFGIVSLRGPMFLSFGCDRYVPAVVYW